MKRKFISLIAIALLLGCESPTEQSIENVKVDTGRVYLSNVFKVNSVVLFADDQGVEIKTVTEFEPYGNRTEVRLPLYDVIYATHYTNSGEVTSKLHIVNMGVYQLMTPVGVDFVDERITDIYPSDTLFN